MNRVQAVRAAIDDALCRYGDSDDLADRLTVAAVEANDAWLAESWSERREQFNEQMRNLIKKRYERPSDRQSTEA